MERSLTVVETEVRVVSTVGGSATMNDRLADAGHR